MPPLPLWEYTKVQIQRTTIILEDAQCIADGFYLNYYCLLVIFKHKFTYEVFNKLFHGDWVTWWLNYRIYRSLDIEKIQESWQDRSSIVPHSQPIPLNTNRTMICHLQTPMWCEIRHAFVQQSAYTMYNRWLCYFLKELEFSNKTGIIHEWTLRVMSIFFCTYKMIIELTLIIQTNKSEFISSQTEENLFIIILVKSWLKIHFVAISIADTEPFEKYQESFLHNTFLLLEK